MRPLDRALAWLYMGPVGHVWSVAADLALFFGGSLLTRARRALRG